MDLDLDLDLDSTWTYLDLDLDCDNFQPLKWVLFKFDSIIKMKNLYEDQILKIDRCETHQT